MQFVVRKNWLNSVKMVCSLSVRGHHSYHFNLLTYVVLFCSFLLNSIHRCCQDFPLYISDRFVPGLALCLFRREPLWWGQGGQAGGAATGTGEAGVGMAPARLRHGVCEKYLGKTQAGVDLFSGEVGIPCVCCARSSAAINQYKSINFSGAAMPADGQVLWCCSLHRFWVRSQEMKGGTAATFKINK